MNMSNKGAIAELPEIGTADEQAHRVVHDWRHNGEGVPTFAIWRSMNIVERMALVMRDVEHVGKTGDNKDQHYKFRPVDEFMNALHLPLVRHEVVITPRVLQRDSFERDRRRNGEIIGITRVVELLVEYTFHSPDGSTLTTVTAGEGADVADKATNKAMAGALKYAIMQTFMVPTREMTDGDVETPEIPSGSRAQQAQQAGAGAAVDAIADKARELGRDAIMHMLDEACEVMGQTRAALTKKWRDANNVGAVAKLDDEDAVPTVELYRYVLSLAPYVQQARARAVAEAQPGSSSASSQPEPGRGGGALCPVVDGDKVCTKIAGHDGDHQWWG